MNVNDIPATNKYEQRNDENNQSYHHQEEYDSDQRDIAYNSLFYDAMGVCVIEKLLCDNRPAPYIEATRPNGFDDFNMNQSRKRKFSPLW